MGLLEWDDEDLQRGTVAVRVRCSSARRSLLSLYLSLALFSQVGENSAIMLGVFKGG